MAHKLNTNQILKLKLKHREVNECCHMYISWQVATEKRIQFS